MGCEAWPEALLDPAVRLRWVHAVLAGVPPTFAVPPRRIGDHVLWVLTGGGITLELDGRSHRLETGDLVWIPPHLPHRAWHHDRRRPLVCYSLRFRVACGDNELGFAVAQVAHDRLDLQPLADAIYRDRCLSDRFSQRRALAGLYLLATSLARGAGRSGPGLSDHQRQRLLLFARRNAARRPAPAELAAVVDLSPDYFARVFKASFGRSPKRWLLEQRMQLAAHRVAYETTPIGDIATELGYDDPALFRRQFKDVIGRSPTEHRRLG